MGREHTPKPGVTWQQEPVTVEVIVDDEAWTVTPWLEPRRTGPFEAAPALNREQRRAMERAKRRKGGRR